jgi:predicted nucleic acid-binding protein
VIVLDASIVVELLTNGSLAESIRSQLSTTSEPLLVPHLLDKEVASALRTLAAARRIDSRTMEEILDALATLPAERFPHMPLLGRIWELRFNFTAYDAAYIALAEVTGSVLHTCDAKLSKGHRAPVVLIRET